MGGFENWRNFMMILFPKCFQDRLEDGTEFCISLVDLMMVLAPCVLSMKDAPFDTYPLLRKIEKTVAYYQNNEEDVTRPLIKTATVVMIDTVHRVPKNKTAKQKMRDGDQCQYMNEELYNKMMTLNEPVNHLFISEGAQQFPYPLEGNTVWRSVNLKLQLYRVVTHHLLCTPVKEGKVLIIDDGPAFAADDFEAVRKRMIDEHHFNERTPFEQECLVHQLLTHSKNFITRYMVWHDSKFRRFESTATGEADIKIQHYIRRDNGAKKFLVVNQDTDVIFILLLHMKTLLKDDETDDDIEVWLDTRSPCDKRDARPYRYINIKKLYYAILRLFENEYPGVLYPVETFCFLVFTQETDFTRRFHKCLQVYDSVVWNVFSELHSCHKDYIKFSQDSKHGLKRQAKQNAFSKELEGLLNHAINYDAVKKSYILIHWKIKNFYFLLCQQRIMNVRKKLSISNGVYDNKNETTLIPPAELLIYAREICEKLEKFKKYEETQQKTFINLLKRKSPHTDSHESVKKLKRSSRPATIIYLEVNDEKEEEEREEIVLNSDRKKPASFTLDDLTYLRMNEAELRVHSKKEIPDQYYGVLNENDMLARVYRVEWYLAYCTDGWRSSPLTYDFTQCARQDNSLSVWGWKQVEHTDISMLNSTYLATRYSPYESPENFFVASEILETNDVYHNRYTQVLPLEEIKL
jgi:hypothetical protein